MVSIDLGRYVLDRYANGEVSDRLTGSTPKQIYLESQTKARWIHNIVAQNLSSDLQRKIASV